MSKADATTSASFERKREAIIGAAARIINSGSFTDMTLTGLAKQLDVKYTSFYHYFESKDDLAVATFTHSCQTRLAALRTATTGQPQASAFERLTHFIEVDVAAPLQVRLTHLSALPRAAQDNLIELVARVQSELAALIEQGMADGSVRPCNPTVTATVILDVLDRFTYPEDPLLPLSMHSEAVAQTLVDIFSGGLLKMPGRLPDLLQHRLDRLPDLAPAAGSDYERIDSMLSTLTRAFNDRGVKGTSIPEQAAAMGVSKTAVYQVAASKEELAFYSMLRGLRIFEVTGLIAESMTNSAADELTLWLRYINWVHYQRAGPIPFFDVLLRLAPHHLRAISARYRAIQSRLLSLLERGLREGALREIDLQVLMRLMLSRPSLYWEHLLPIGSANTEVADAVDEATTCLWTGLAPG